MYNLSLASQRLSTSLGSSPLAAASRNGCCVAAWNSYPYVVRRCSVRHHLGRLGGCLSSVCGVGTGGSKGACRACVAGPECAVEDAIAYDVIGGVAESVRNRWRTGRDECVRAANIGMQEQDAWRVKSK